MSRSPFRTSIYARRRNDAPFVDRPQAISNYSHPDETPDPACVPSADEVPVASCPACGLELSAPATDVRPGPGGEPEFLYWCPRCGRVVIGEW